MEAGGLAAYLIRVLNWTLVESAPAPKQDNLGQHRPSRGVLSCRCACSLCAMFLLDLIIIWCTLVYEASATWPTGNIQHQARDEAFRGIIPGTCDVFERKASL